LKIKILLLEAKHEQIVFWACQTILC